MKKHKFTRPQVREIKWHMAKENKKKIKDTKALSRLMALHLRAMGKQNKEISEIVGFSPQYITELVKKYVDSGMSVILEDKRTGNNRNMSVAQEEAFLEQFLELAEAGQIFTIQMMIEKYEKITGKPCADTTIYRLLKRHGWRKIAPRPEHPGKARDEDIESSKKLSNRSEGCLQKFQKIETKGN